MRVHYMGYILPCTYFFFWTSSVHSSTSTSNPSHNFFPFGLLLASPPLQRPIRHAASSLLDFLRALLYFTVQSAAPFRSFWTFAGLPSTSTSNLPRHFFPFGLPPCIPLLQRPIRRAASSLLDFLRVFHYFNVQSQSVLSTISSIANILIANLPTMCV